MTEEEAKDFQFAIDGASYYYRMSAGAKTEYGNRYRRIAGGFARKIREAKKVIAKDKPEQVQA